LVDLLIGLKSLITPPFYGHYTGQPVYGKKINQ